jgi:amino acid transporter
VPSALVAITIVGVGIIFVFINTFANLGINTSNLINGTGNQLDFLGALIAVAVLFAFIGVSAIPALIQTIKNHTLPNYLDDLHH